jgi:hypothetical protein
MKYQFLRHMIVATMLFMPGIWSATARADLIGYWPFDEVVEVDGERQTPDASGEGHDGVLSDAAVLAEDGVRGTVMDFGEFNNGAVVELPSFPQDDRAAAGVDPDKGPGFNAIVDSQNVTISYWLNRQGEPATDQWTFLFDDSGNRQLGSHAPWSNSNIYFDVSGCCGVNQRINADMMGADTDDAWHHIAYVKRKLEGEDKATTAIYLDGSVLVSSPGWNGDADPTIDDVVPITAAAIGAAPGGGNSQNGLMDDFAIFNEALSDEAILNLAQGGCIICGTEAPGDFNDDKVVDLKDFMILATGFNQKFPREESYAHGDFDRNARVDMKDFFKFRELWLSLPQNGAAATAAAVPEPSSLTLAALAGLIGLAVRRRTC